MITEPYSECSVTDWWTQYTISMALRGNFFGQIIERDGEMYPTQIKPVHPDQANVRRLPDGKIEYRLLGKVVPNQDVFHVRYLTVPGGLLGLNPVEYLRNSLGLARAQDLYGAAWFQNSAMPSGVIQAQGELDPEEVLALARRWNATHQGIGQSSLPAVLTEGMEFKAVSMNPEDSQFIECVVPETLVTMADGREIRADEIAVDDSVMGWNGEQLVPSRVSQAKRNEPTRLVKVRTHRGRELTTTFNHPYLSSHYVTRATGSRTTQRGAHRVVRTDGAWTKAADLRVGDYVRVGLSMPLLGDMTFEEGWMIGALVGDGHLRERGVGFSNVDQPTIARMSTCAETIGGSLRTVGDGSKGAFYFAGFEYGKKNKLRRMLREHRLMGTRSSTKFVPENIQLGGTEAWRGFLSGYLDTDGTVSHLKAAQPVVKWTSTSQRLIAGCQGLLAKLGIQSSVYNHYFPHGTKLRPEPYTQYELIVCGRSQVAAVAGLLDPANEDKKARLAGWAESSPKKSEDTPLQTEWDRIVSIEEVQSGETILLTIDDTHSHVTNGIITHNSRGFSQGEISGMLFRVPPHMIGIVDRSTSWGRGIEQQETGFVRNTLASYIIRGERALTTLLRPKEFVEFDINQRMRGDKLERYQAYSLGMLGGWEVADEVRAEEGKPPLPNGLGKVPLAPINTEPLEAMLDRIKEEKVSAAREEKQEAEGQQPEGKGPNQEPSK